MAGVNKVIIIGNLGADPELRTMPNGEAVANISVATSESWKDRNSGETREVTEWHRIVLYRRLAEIVGEYLHKGSKVYIEGRLKTRKWQDQNGIDRYTTEIICDSMQMLDTKNHANATPSVQQNATSQSAQSASTREIPQPMDFDDDIPFAPLHHGHSKHTIHCI